MKARWFLMQLFVGVMVVVFALAACGTRPTGSSSDGMSSMPGMGAAPGATSTAIGGSTTQQPNTVRVTLSDYKIEASQTSFKVGVPYHFVVTNAQSSSARHELMLMVPMRGDGMSMDDMDRMALVHVNADELPPGATRSVDVTFQKPAAQGELEFACHIGSHYSLGMHTPITVTER